MRKCDFCKGPGYFPNILTMIGSGLKKRKDCHVCEGKGEYPDFNEDDKKEFMASCQRTYQAIGDDLESSMEGQRLTKAIIVECVLDADRIQMYGAPYNIRGEERKGYLIRMDQINHSNIAEKLCRKAVA